MKKVVISAVLAIAAVGGIFVGTVAAQASQTEDKVQTSQTVTIKPIVLEAGGSAGLN